MLSKHAAIRTQQRGIPPVIHDWLITYGEEQHDGRGSLIRYFTAKNIREMEQDFGNDTVRRFAEHLNAYLVERTDGLIVTVGKRYKNQRITRH